MATTRKKFVIVGDGACGKTWLMHAFRKETLPEEYMPTPTVVENFVADIQVKRKRLGNVSLCNTSGLEDYDRLRPLAYTDVDVIVMCFSIDSRDSMENISAKWNPEVRLHCPFVPVVLVGNKKDLRDGIDELGLVNRDQVHAQVMTAEGHAEAVKIDAFAYVECSAVTREGVEEVFKTAAKAAIRADKKRGKCNIL